MMGNLRKPRKLKKMMRNQKVKNMIQKKVMMKKKNLNQRVKKKRKRRPRLNL